MQISFLKQCRTLLIAAALGCVSSWSVEIEPINSKTLIESCKQVSDKTAFRTCAAYIQGFLDATPHIVEEEQLASDYVIRAIKTRAPKKDVIVRSILNARYCVPEKGFVNELVTKISEVEYNSLQHQSPSSLIKSVLKTNYSCNP